MSERFIFCRGERLAYETITLITSKYNAQVFPHLRIKEVANKDWIKEEDFDYALKGHIDFTICRDFVPVLALELDGRFHQSVKSRERDRKKDQLCESLGIPLVRVDSGYMRQELLQPVLAELIDAWLSGGMRKYQHLHSINATCLQLEEAANYARGSVEAVAGDDGWFVQVVSSTLEQGYSEANVEFVFPSGRVPIGRGRSKVPRGSLVCGRWLAERIAVADAGVYVRTIGGTVKDAYSEAEAPVEAKCADCDRKRREQEIICRMHNMDVNVR